MPNLVPQSHLQTNINTNTNTEMWATQIDPRLLSTSSSTLAAALATSSHHPSTAYSLPAPIPASPPSETLSQSHATSAPLLDLGVSSQDNQTPISASTHGQLVMSTLIPANATAPITARYCSVKGCKAIMPNGYFYKMCESCRER